VILILILIDPTFHHFLIQIKHLDQAST
jgi:hypothetical protein